MGANYPWGPHGPQAGPNQVTPNPTPAYVPPPAPSGGSWAPAPSVPYSGGGGGNYAGSGTAAGTYTPRPKSYVLALILGAVFGPFGLLYVSARGALLLLLLLGGVPVTLAKLGAYGPALHRFPLEVLGRDAVMNPMWRLCVMASLVWAVIGVWRHNRRLKG